MPAPREHFARWNGERWLRIGCWVVGTALAALQAWALRYHTTADSISYLDMSDAVTTPGEWRRMISGVWSPLYPFLLGIVRLVLRPSRYQEIAVAHAVNVFLFLFAFAGFEFLLRSLLRHPAGLAARSERGQPLPAWGFMTIGYALFLWASITQISLSALRPDLLMSGFVYLALGVLLRMRGRAPSWSLYLALGVVWGLGYLAKAPMLPLGLFMLGMSFFLVDNWRRAMPKAALALGLMVVLGSIYFVPLSLIRGHFTMGESASFNYLYHVDRAGPVWYFQNVGAGTGQFKHNPRRIFPDPATYTFPIEERVTHPLRFDPLYWTEGARPRFKLTNELQALRENSEVYLQALDSSIAALLGFAVLCFWPAEKRQSLGAFLKQCPVWLLGIAGFTMYEAVHVESRYIGVFFVIFWLGLFASLRLRSSSLAKLVPLIAAATTIALLIPIGLDLRGEVVMAAETKDDTSAGVAAALEQLGIHQGDRVARISPYVADLGWARVARASIIAEVDLSQADSFWTASQSKQHAILDALDNTGVRAVVAHTRADVIPPAGWKELGNTFYWVHLSAPRIDQQQ